MGGELVFPFFCGSRCLPASAAFAQLTRCPRGFRGTSISASTSLSCLLLSALHANSFLVCVDLLCLVSSAIPLGNDEKGLAS